MLRRVLAAQAIDYRAALSSAAPMTRVDRRDVAAHAAASIAAAHRVRPVGRAVGCQPPPAATAQPAPGWHVVGGQIDAPDGRVVILRGANVTGAQKTPPYIDAGTTMDDYAALGLDLGA